MSRRFGLFTLTLCASFIFPAGCSKKNAAPTPEVGPPEAGASKAGAANVKVAPSSGDAFKKIMGDLKSKSLERRASAISRIAEYETDEVIPVLLETLNDKTFTEGFALPDEPNSTREAVVLALFKFGADGEKALLDSGMKVLIDGLSDSTSAVREHSALALGLIGAKAKPAVPALLKLCVDKTDKDARQAAYDALRRIKGVPPMSIVALMKNPDPHVAYDAARYVSTIRPLPKEAIPVLIDVLNAPAAEMEPDEAALNRNEAAEALATFGKAAEAAVPALIGVMKATTAEDFDKYFRPRNPSDPNAARDSESTAMMTLRKIGKPAVPALIEALDNDKAIVRWEAATVLGGIGMEAKEALPALQKAFKKEFEFPTRELASVGAIALAAFELGDEPKEMISKLTEVLGLIPVENGAMRAYVATVLSRFGSKAESAVPAILPLLDDTDEGVRQRAARALRAIGPGAKAAIPLLVQKLAVEKERNDALSTLKAMGPVAAEATPLLIKLLADPDESFRRDVVQAIQAIGPAAKSAVPEMAKLLKPGREKERQQVLETLASFGPEAKQAVPEVVAMVAERDNETRQAAVSTLGKLDVGSAEVVAALTECMRKDNNMPIRVQAIRSLAMLGPKAKSAEADLKKLVENKNSTANIYAAAALYRIGVDADANLQVVVAAMKNKEPAGRFARLTAFDAADILGSGSKAVLPELIDCLSDKTPAAPKSKTLIRERAVLALGKMGPGAKSAVPKMTALLKESDANLKRVVIEALGQIGPDAEYASARLREVARSDPALAEAAQDALSKIEKK